MSAFAAAGTSVLSTRSGQSGVALLLGLIALTMLAPSLGASADVQVLPDRLNGPSWSHLFGTDQLGRDMLSRVAEALRGTMWTALLVAAISGLGGGLLGLLSGYLGGWLDLLVQRVVDTVMAIPLLVLALAIVTATGPGRTGVIVALSIAFAPLSVRVARSSAATLRTTDYVQASRLTGAPWWTVLRRHLVPNALGPWIAVVSTQVGGAALAEASLSFLGAGPSGAASLGGLLGREAQTYMHGAPWLIVWPGITLALLAVSANLVGDSLVEAAAPERSAGRR